MFGVLQDKVRGRALVELEGDPALGELQELTLLVGRRCRIVIHALGQLTSPDKASSDRVAPSALAKRCGGRVHENRTRIGNSDCTVERWLSARVLSRQFRQPETVRPQPPLIEVGYAEQQSPPRGRLHVPGRKRRRRQVEQPGTQSDVDV